MEYRLAKRSDGIGGGGIGKEDAGGDSGNGTVGFEVVVLVRGNDNADPFCLERKCCC